MFDKPPKEKEHPYDGGPKRCYPLEPPRELLNAKITSHPIKSEFWRSLDEEF